MLTRLTSHRDVVAAATDPVTFSSNTSRHLNVPNTMDGEQHRKFRQLIERYMTPEVVAGLQPTFVAVAQEVIAELPADQPFEAVRDLGAKFAVRAQCDWLGWPRELEQRLLDWMDANHAANRSGEQERNAAVARDFGEIVRQQVEPRQQRRESAPSWEPRDVTDSLLQETVDGRELELREVVSILRNWTAGDLSSLAQSIGVILERVARDGRLQERLRYLSFDDAATHPGAAQQEFNAIIDECLRINDPFLSNRRITTCPVTLPSGQELGNEEVVLLDWVQANRDPEVFGDPDHFDPHGNQAQNLVYGIGPHVCPGRELATAELRILVAYFLRASAQIELVPGDLPEPEVPPLGGWARVPLMWHR